MGSNVCNATPNLQESWVSIVIQRNLGFLGLGYRAYKSGVEQKSTAFPLNGRVLIVICYKVLKHQARPYKPDILHDTRHVVIDAAQNCWSYNPKPYIYIYITLNPQIPKS